MTNQKNKNISSKLNKFYFVTMIFIILSFSTYLFYKYDTLLEYDNKINELNEKINLANEENEELNYQTEYKNSDEYIEKLARDKLGMVKNNEIIFYDNN